MLPITSYRNKASLLLHIPEVCLRLVLAKQRRGCRIRTHEWLLWRQLRLATSPIPYWDSFDYPVRWKSDLATDDRVTGENRTHDEWITTTCLTIWRRPQWLQGISKSRPTRYECVALPLSYGALRAVFNLYKLPKGPVAVVGLEPFLDVLWLMRPARYQLLHTARACSENRTRLYCLEGSRNEPLYHTGIAFMVSKATLRSSAYPALTGPLLTMLNQIAAPDSVGPYTLP